MSSFDKQPKKRQRVTSSCSVCRARKTKCDKRRPVCSSCIKSNLEDSCVYEIPHWVYSTITEDQSSIVTLKPTESVFAVSSSTAASPASKQPRFKQQTIPKSKALKKNATSSKKSSSLSVNPPTHHQIQQQQQQRPPLPLTPAQTPVVSENGYFMTLFPQVPMTAQQRQQVAQPLPKGGLPGPSQIQSYSPATQPQPMISTIKPEHEPYQQFKASIPPPPPIAHAPQIPCDTSLNSVSTVTTPAFSGASPPPMYSMAESPDRKALAESLKTTEKLNGEVGQLHKRIRDLEEALNKQRYQHEEQEKQKKQQQQQEKQQQQQQQQQHHVSGYQTKTSPLDQNSQYGNYTYQTSDSTTTNDNGNSNSKHYAQENVYGSEKLSTDNHVAAKFISGRLPVIDEREYHNFSSTYYSYIFKRNSLTDVKALSHNSLIARDKFLMNFFVKFLLDYNSVKSMISTMFKNRQANESKSLSNDDDKSSFNVIMPEDQKTAIKSVVMKIAKKNEFATLIYNMMKARTTYKDKRLAFRHDVATLQLSGPNNRQTMFSNILNNEFYSANRILAGGNELVFDLILKALPRIKILRYLWKMFVLYIHPFIPILDIRDFSMEINKILEGLELHEMFHKEKQTVDEEKRIEKIKIREKMDYGTLAVFLIILRLAYLAIKFNMNNIKIMCDIEQEMLSYDPMVDKDPVPPEFVELAQMCLNFLKTTKKASYIVVIALIFLYNYTELREEGRIGFGLQQNHLMFSKIISKAKHIGLHKDWKNDEIIEFHKSLGAYLGSLNHFHGSNHFHGTDKEVYRCRKLWYYLVNLDSSTSISHGKLLYVSSDEEYDTRFPNLDESTYKSSDFPEVMMIPEYVPIDNKHESIIDFEKVEHIVLQNMKLEYEVNKVFIQISKLFNNLKTPVKLTVVMQMILKVEQLLMTDELCEDRFINYCKPAAKQEDDQNQKIQRVKVKENYYKIVDYLHKLKMHYNLKLCCFILTFIMFLHYDTSKDSIHGVNNTLFFLKKSFMYALDIIKLSKEFLCHNEDKLNISVDFSKTAENDQKGLCYGFKNFNFIILPTIDTMCYRAMLMVETLLLRLAHCLSMIDGLIKKRNSSNFLLVTISIDEYQRKRDFFRDMYLKLYRFHYKLVKLLVEKFAKFYSHSYKETLIFQYYLVCFKNPTIIANWFKKRDMYFDSTNNLINLSINDIIELRQFIDTLINFDEERFPDNISDNLMNNHFGQAVAEEPDGPSPAAAAATSNGSETLNNKNHTGYADSAKKEIFESTTTTNSSANIDVNASSNAVTAANSASTSATATSGDLDSDPERSPMSSNGGTTSPSMPDLNDNINSGGINTGNSGKNDLLNANMDKGVADAFKQLMEEFFGGNNNSDTNGSSSGNDNNNSNNNRAGGSSKSMNNSYSYSNTTSNNNSVVDDSEFSFYNLDLNNYLSGNPMLQTEGIYSNRESLQK